MKRLLDKIQHIDWYLAAALLCAIAAALPLMEPHALLNTRGGGDSPFLLQRTHQLLAALSEGQLPARWMPDGYFGNGYPFFNFYAPLSIYVAAAFKLLGLSFTRAIQLAQLSGFLVAAWAVYRLLRAHRRGPAAALLASVVYTFAPFHMVNVYVRGDSLAEFWAMAFYPLTLLSAEKLLHAASKRSAILYMVGLASAFAGLVLSHNISALIFAPFLLLYCIVGLLFQRRREGNPSPTDGADAWRSFIFYAIAALLGVALSAWFWLPALAGQDAVQLGPVTEGYFNYAGHFRGIDLVQRALAFDYTVTGSEDPFRMGLVQTVVILAGMLSALWLWRRATSGDRRQMLFAVATTVVATFMMTPASGALWAHLPLLEFTQFPWRFLSVQALGGALLASWLVPSQLPQRRALGVTCLLAVGVAWSALAALETDFIALTDADVSAESLIDYEWFSGNVGTTISAEYLPAEVQPRVWVASAQGIGTLERATPATTRLAELVSLAALIASAVMLIKMRPPVQRAAAWAALLMVIAFAFRVVDGPPPAFSSQLDTRSWDFAQQAYLHHAPDGIHFADGSLLKGYTVTVSKQNEVAVTLHWDGTGGEVSVDLVTPAVHRQTATQPVPAIGSATASRDSESTELLIALPETVPAGRYLPRLRLPNVPALTETGEPRGDLFLAPFDVETVGEAASVTALTVEVVDVTAQPTGNLLAAVRWATPEQLLENYQASWKLYDRFGRFYAEVDAQPWYGQAPTSYWEPNRWVYDWVELHWLAQDGIEPYTLVGSLRNVASEEVVFQQPVARISRHNGLTFEPVEPLLDLPAGATAADAMFGNAIALRGVASESLGTIDAVTLYWEALQDDLADYQRFVHIIDPASGEIVLQADGRPQYNTSPTSRWQRGQLNMDTVAIDTSSLPPATYELRVGLYQVVESTYPRLPITATALQHESDTLRLPIMLTIARE